MRRSTRRPVVDLPDPLSPTRPRISPRPMSKSTPSTARTCPTVRRIRPFLTGKTFSRSAYPQQRRGRRRCGSPVIAWPPVARSAWRMQRTLRPSSSRLERGRRGRARLDRVRAAGWNRQPIGNRLGIGTVPAIMRSRSPFGDRLRHRVEQPDAVRVAGRGEEVVDRRLLDDLAGVHHRHLVAHVGDHAEVVGHEDDRHAELVLQLAQELEDLALDRHVERGGGLVGDEQPRRADQRHRDHHPLAHPAREVVRVLADAPSAVPGSRRGGASPRRASAPPSSSRPCGCDRPR